MQKRKLGRGNLDVSALGLDCMGMSFGRRRCVDDRGAGGPVSGQLAEADRSVTRPRVICHMMASVDGRIVTQGWPLGAEARKQYELVHASYEADGWICGRVTMEPFAKRVRPEAEVAREHSGGPREDYVAPGEAACRTRSPGRGTSTWPRRSRRSARASACGR